MKCGFVFEGKHFAILIMQKNIRRAISIPEMTSKNEQQLFRRQSGVSCDMKTPAVKSYKFPLPFFLKNNLNKYDYHRRV